MNNYSGASRVILQEADTITRPISQRKRAAPTEKTQRNGAGSLPRYLLLIIAAALVMVPALAGVLPDNSTLPGAAGPQVVKIGMYIVDFKNYNVADGTIEANFYLSLKSDSNVSIQDLEMVNGQANAIGTLIDTPHEKYYRVFAVLTTDPDFSHYPFDRHVIPIQTKPKIKNEQELIFVIDRNMSGIDPEANLLGWEIAGTRASVTNKSYSTADTPYSEATFDVDIGRDTASTFLKFFLPIMLIIIVSLASLMMKVSSRLGLNASMFLAAVLIHWRVADAIPLVGYATFLDMFMIVTYGTLVMVLLSGILIMKFTETGDTVNVEEVYYWSLRIIPAVSVAAYCLLFLSLKM
jgi:hypothetical protein